MNEQGGLLEMQRADEDYDNMLATKQLEIIKEMLTDTNIPEAITNGLWGLASKFIILGNIDQTDERIFLREYDIVVNSALAGMCVSNIDTALLNKIKNFKVVFRAMLTRAKGPDRERKLQAMQILQHISTTEGGRGGEFKKPGFFSKTFGKLVGRRKPATPEQALMQVRGT